MENSGPRTGDSGYHRRSDVVESGFEQKAAAGSLAANHKGGLFAANLLGLPVERQMKTIRQQSLQHQPEVWCGGRTDTFATDIRGSRTDPIWAIDLIFENVIRPCDARFQRHTAHAEAARRSLDILAQHGFAATPFGGIGLDGRHIESGGGGAVWARTLRQQERRQAWFAAWLLEGRAGSCNISGGTFTSGGAISDVRWNRDVQCIQ